MPPSSLAEIISCLSGYDPEALPVEKARQIVEQFVAPVGAIEKVALRSALGRVLAEEIISPMDVPAHDNSAMDGYAVRFADLDLHQPAQLRIAGTGLAGTAQAASLAPGTCLRIMTGAPMPPQADTVVPQEFIAAQNKDSITVPPGAVKAGDHRRLRGEDLQAGKPALLSGKILRPADLGLIASLGITEVPVRRRVRVAFFSTGDELRSLGEPLDAGCVYDSNRYTLFGMLSRLGCELLDMGVIRDDPVALEAAFRSACENADMVITSGGVSVGEADYTKQVMARLGEVKFWKIAMRPGRPMAFGKIASNGKSAYLFGLPGNPVAVMVTFYFFAREALLRMMGAASKPLPLMKARSQNAIRKKPGRTEFQRAVLSMNGDGMPQVSITGSQGSGILRSMSEASCMVVLSHHQGNVQPGDVVDVLLFEGLV